jgi:hypothetical protein
MTTAGGTLDVTARLTYVPRDPHVITVAITDRAGAVLIWTVGRDLLLGGLIARASCPAGMGQIRLWTCQSRSGPSLIIARMTSHMASAGAATGQLPVPLADTSVARAR